MQHLNDGMDELFKKAGENYYLKESASGWDDVASSLSNLTKTEAIVTKTKNK